MSLQGPIIPVYGRIPVSDHSHGRVSIVDESHDGSMETLSMGYPYKTPGSDNTSFDTLSTLAHARTINCSLSMRAHDGFASPQTMLQAHMATFPDPSGSTSSMPMYSGSASFNGLPLSSASTSFDGLPYTDFHGGPIRGSDDMINGEPRQPIWSSYYAMEHMVAPATMAPALLGGGYVDINT
jgi:hypothetical protein